MEIPNLNPGGGNIFLNKIFSIFKIFVTSYLSLILFVTFFISFGFKIALKDVRGGGVPLAYNPDYLQLRLSRFPIANTAIAYKQLLRTFKN